MAPAKKFIFDRRNLVLPAHLQTIIPKRVHDELRNVRETATVSFNALKKLERLYSQRYYRMCSKSDREHYYIHRDSIDRLMSWQADHEPKGRHAMPTLAPSPKISPAVLHFHVDERAYASYEEEYARLRIEYIRGPYMKWLAAKDKMDKALQESEISEMDHRQWYRWWNATFLKEMANWEDRVQEIVLPSWREIVNELYDLIVESVDVDELWA